MAFGVVFAMREMEQPIYTKQCEVGRDIYGKNRRVDFLLYHPRKWPQSLVIQCKWQASSGSVEEKYPFEVLSIQQGAMRRSSSWLAAGTRRGRNSG